MVAVGALSANALAGVPEVREGDDVAQLVCDAAGPRRLRDGQLLVIAHKIVSKAEGAVVSLATVRPGSRARGRARRPRVSIR